MPIWYRVFGTSPETPAPASLLAQLPSPGGGRLSLEGDPGSWLAVDLELPGGQVLRVERYATGDPDLRGELNSWAAWLETSEPRSQAEALMEHMIQTAQLFTLEAPKLTDGMESFDGVCVALARYLAQATAGIYQVDGSGLFAADGTLLVPE